MFIISRAIELVYTAWDLAPFAADLWQEADEPLRRALRAQWEANRQATGGHEWAVGSEQWSVNSGEKPPFPPFKWDDNRRAQLRAELDAYYGRLYGLSRDELRYILDPADIYGPEFPGETFRVLKEKEIKAHGEYRTQRLVLAAWDAQEAAIAQGELSFTEATSREAGSGVPYAPQPTPPATVQEPGPKLELKRPSVESKASVGSRPLLGIQPPLVTDFTPPAGSYAQKLKRVMALGRAKNQIELAELVAALGDDEGNIRWLASSALINLGGLPVVNMLAAYLQTNAPVGDRREALKVLTLIADTDENETVRQTAQALANRG